MLARVVLRVFVIRAVWTDRRPVRQNGWPHCNPSVWLLHWIAATSPYADGTDAAFRQSFDMKTSAKSNTT